MRVLFTDRAKAAMQQMQAVLNGGLVEQIRKLDAAARTLSDPNDWDGPAAAEFRDAWPGTKSALDKTLIELDELRYQLQKISSSLRPAGDGPEERPAPRGPNATDSVYNHNVGGIDTASSGGSQSGGPK